VHHTTPPIPADPSSTTAGGSNGKGSSASSLSAGGAGIPLRLIASSNIMDDNRDNRITNSDRCPETHPRHIT